MSISDINKKNKRKYLQLLSVALVLIIIVSLIGWSIFGSKKEFNITVLSTSGKKIMALIYVWDSDDRDNFFDFYITKNGLDKNASHSFNINPPCKNLTVLVETRDYSNDQNISHQFYYFHNNVYYDLLVNIQEFGETINITKMPGS